MYIEVIIGQMLVLFAMMMIGVFLYKKKWIDDAASEKLSKMVVMIFNPLLIVYAVTGKGRGKDYSLLFQNLGLSVLYFVILMVAASVLIWVLRPSKKERNIYRMLTLFANVGFFGIPVVSSIYGKTAVIYVVFYMLGFNLLLYSYGMIVARNAGRDAGVVHDRADARFTDGLKKMVNPGVIASVFAILVFVLQIPLPTPVVTFTDYVGNATIPLSMILIGISIAKADFKSIFNNGKLYVFILLRMVILPIVLFLILKNLPINQMILGIFVLEMGMPVGTVTVLMARENGADEGFCTDGIVLTTLASIVTIPLLGLFI